MSVTYPAPNPPFIAAKWHGGDQDPLHGMIVLHSTVSPCVVGGAHAVAEYFANEADKTSAHYVVDPENVYQCVKDHTVAYHCGYNNNSIGIEMCDIPSRVNIMRWFDANHRAMRRRTVILVAELCLAYDIRPYYVSVSDLRKGITGVTTHANMSDAFKRSTHWDPGVWPRLAFMRGVRREIKARKSKGVS